MSDLETTLMISLGVMLLLHIFQRRAIRELRGIVIAVGKGDAHIEINDEERVIRVIHRK